jgi:hypothetical protein
MTEVLAGIFADGSSQLTAPLQQASAAANVPRFGRAGAKMTYGFGAVNATAAFSDQS